jgi:aminomethyltransferase
MNETVASAVPLSRLPLHDLHVARGAKLVPFAGYSMPVQYTAGVLKEHQHTRSAAGLFDVSHMGQAMLRPRSGRVEDAAQALERLVPADIVALSRDASATPYSPRKPAGSSTI